MTHARIHEQNSRGGSFVFTPSFVRIWIATTTSSFGDHIFETTLVLWIVTHLAYGESWAALAISGIYLASTIPTLIFGPFAGVYVDRHDPRRTIIVASCLSALVITFIAVLSSSWVQAFLRLDQAPLMVVVYLVTGLAAVLVQVIRPASSVLLKDVLPSEHVVKAFSYTNVTSNLVMLAGPALASVLFFQFGPTVGLALNALSFAGALCLVSLPVSSQSTPYEPNGASVITEMRVGFSHFRHSRPLVALAVGMGTMVIAGGIINSLSIFFLTENLRASERLFGLFASFQAGGMLCGALLGIVIVARIDVWQLFWIAVVGIGIMIVAFSRQTAYIPGVICIALIGVFVSLIPLALGPIMMRSTPRELLGRTNSVMTLLLGVASVIGLGCGGLLYTSVFDNVMFQFATIQFDSLSLIFGLSGVMCILAGFWARHHMHLSLTQSYR